MNNVVIIGGGLAGLTLGILLRRDNVPVELWDTNSYPRHRVCGEFISGEGASLLLQLLPELDRRVRRLETVRFFTNDGSTDAISLPQPGISISRSELDARLAEVFQECGGKLVRQRWTHSFESPGLVRATGRRLATQSKGWTGLKAHVRELPLSADLEMHFSNEGYLGIARLPEGANLCALVNEHCLISDFRQKPAQVFDRLICSPGGTPTLAGVEYEALSVCAVSGISFRTAQTGNECCIGDAIRMIPPFTGNGMSLAIESAFIAAPHLRAYSVGEADWRATRKTVRGECTQRFRKRFAGATAFRWIANRSWTRALMLSSLRTVPRLLSICFGVTR